MQKIKYNYDHLFSISSIYKSDEFKDIEILFMGLIDFIHPENFSRWKRPNFESL